MQKEIRQLSRFASWFLATVTLLGMICPPRTVAQAGSPITQLGDVWELNYLVSVFGTFTVEPELGSGNPTVTYDIDRVYEGRARLVRAKSVGQRFVFGDPSTTEVDIQIDDKRKAIGDPTCEEYEITNETWIGEMSTLTGLAKYRPFSQLSIDNENRVYKTSFHIFYSPNKNQYDIDHTKVTEVKSAVGTKAVKPFPVEHLRYPDYGHLPNVKGHIEQNKIVVHSFPWSELKKRDNFTWPRLDTRDRLTWVSEELHPDEPLINGVPESKEKVTIFIRYALKRIKG